MRLVGWFFRGRVVRRNAALSLALREIWTQLGALPVDVSARVVE